MPLTRPLQNFKCGSYILTKKNDTRRTYIESEILRRGEVRTKFSGIKKTINYPPFFCVLPNTLYAELGYFTLLSLIPFFGRGQLRITHTSYATLSSGILNNGHEHLVTISYPTSASAIILLLKTHPKYGKLD